MNNSCGGFDANRIMGYDRATRNALMDPTKPDADDIERETRRKRRESEDEAYSRRLNEGFHMLDNDAEPDDSIDDDFDEDEEFDFGDDEFDDIDDEDDEDEDFFDDDMLEEDEDDDEDDFDDHDIDDE